ncbi:hypothetical protein [Chitinophaga sp. sic0106]|nr:hypothetical protein [Chitinophaga sp. sic0106]MBV7533467.1 hypothetical protein [Chitinophaga sp. sic0106]
MPGYSGNGYAQASVVEPAGLPVAVDAVVADAADAVAAVADAGVAGIKH